jgi:hypothetical protein
VPPEEIGHKKHKKTQKGGRRKKRETKAAILAALQTRPSSLLFVSFCAFCGQSLLNLARGEDAMRNLSSSLPSRRQWLRQAGNGFGYLALTALLADEATGAGPPASRIARASSPLAPKRPHFRARAKRVIFLFMPGGPSQVDTFDPKPHLTKDHGKPSPKLYLGQRRALLGSPWKFR